MWWRSLLDQVSDHVVKEDTAVTFLRDYQAGRILWMLKLDVLV
jgi:hypothetical protein